MLTNSRNKPIDYKSNILFNKYEEIIRKIFGEDIDLRGEPSIKDLLTKTAVYLAKTEAEEKKLNNNEVPPNYVEKRVRELIAKSVAVELPAS